ncbi:hypothetical protein [Kordia sp.]|uniref:hypothetical protein n=1 Tax=Kordia sp. TaxID=1965332 RepID=UPI003B5ABE71
MRKIYVCSFLCLVFSISYAQVKSNKVATVEINKTVIPFIDKLQNNEQFTLHYSSKGCFHDVKESMTFQKEQDAYYVICQKERKKLDATTLEAIRIFEKELSAQQNNGLCTTVDHYLLIYNKSQRIISDGSCSWHGYSILKQKLGFRQYS